MRNGRHGSAALLAAIAGALAACSDPDVIHQYDPYSGSAFPNHRQPFEIPQEGLGIVTDSLGDTLSLIHLGTGERIGVFPVGRDPVGIDGPHHVVADKATNSVYIGLSYPVIGGTGPHSSHGLGTLPGYAQRIALDDFQVLGQVRVDANPGEIVLSEDGKRLVLSHFDLQRAIQNPANIEKARASVAIIDDPTTIGGGTLVEPRRVSVCITPHAMVLSKPDGAIGYVACHGEDSVAVVDLDEGKVADRVPVQPGSGSMYDPMYGPYSMAMSPDGKTIAIGNTASKDVRFFDVGSSSIDTSRTFGMVGAPFFAAWSMDGTRLYVPAQSPDSISLIDVAGGNQEIARRDFTGDQCRLPHVADVLDDTRVLLVCEGDHVGPGKVLVLDAETLETKVDTEVGIYPDGIAKVFP